MKLKIENLGVIKECEIETKPLTIFCGPNNSGKTYLSYLLYGIETYNYKMQYSSIDLDELLNEKFSYSVEKLQKNKFVINQINNQFKKNLSSFFNFDANFFKETKIDVIDFKFKKNINSIYHAKQENEIKISCEKTDDFLEFEILQESTKEDNKFLIERLFEGYMRKSCFILPSMRDGLNLVRVELNSNRSGVAESFVRVGNYNDYSSRRVSRYSKPVSDYIKYINELEGIKQKVGKYTNLANKIAKLVGGSYSYDSSIITFSPYKSNIKLPLHMVSATVRSLAGLYFYLKYTDDIDNIVIDEPELNLHPQNQSLFAKLIVEMVNSGINVIMTTHSPYIIREINNMYLLTKNVFEKDKIMKKYKYNKENMLQSQDFVSYLVDNGTVEEMIKTDEGLMMDTFNKTIELLNDSFNEIFYSVDGE